MFFNVTINYVWKPRFVVQRLWAPPRAKFVQLRAESETHVRNPDMIGATFRVRPYVVCVS